jgi:small subunit ribosomal protein S21
MLKVKIDEKTPLEKALKQLKGKVIKTKQNEKLRERLQYEKPSVARRTQKLKAKYVESQKPKD